MADGEWASEREKKRLYGDPAKKPPAIGATAFPPKPPIDVIAVVAAAAESEAAKRVLKYGRVNVAEWVEWVMNALGEDDVQRHQAPSSGAYAMYVWAKKCPNEFYSSYAARLLPTRQQVDKRDRFSDDGSGVGKLVDMLSEGVKDDFEVAG